MSGALAVYRARDIEDTVQAIIYSNKLTLTLDVGLSLPLTVVRTNGFLVVDIVQASLVCQESQLLISCSLNRMTSQRR